MGKKRSGYSGRRLRRLFLSARVLVPAMLSIPFLMMSSWDWRSWGVGLLSISAATVIWRLTAGKQKLDRKAMDDALRVQRRAHDDRLKTIRRTLRRDRDPRSSQMVKQLKTIFDRLWTLSPDPIDEAFESTEVHEQIAELYDTCLTMLERSFEFWRGAQGVRTDNAKHQLLDSRDDLLEQVETSIDHLDAALDGLQTTKIDLRDKDLKDRSSRLQQELEQGLEVARAVEKRMEDLEQRLRKIERE